METNAVAFESIGFHAALILNKLRNHQRIEGDRREDEQSGDVCEEHDEAARRELTDERRLVGNKKRSSR